MKLIAFLVAAVLSIAVWSCSLDQAASPDAANKPEQTAPAGPKQPVLVELFTSEGCSSCPPADRALALLESQQPVNSADTITLEFHVDYWDGPEWKDPFSSSLYSQRQEEYSSAFKLGGNYTPQMVVDGRSEFVGSDLGKATQTIQKFASEPQAKADASVTGGSIKISIIGLPRHDTATAYLAAVEDGLTSNVTGGENSGAKLPHTSVVRELRTAGIVEKGSDKFETEGALLLQSSWKKENTRYVVFVQENASRKILAVGRAAIK